MAQQTRRKTKTTNRNTARTNRAQTGHTSRTEHVERVPVNEPAQREEYGGFNFGAAFFGWLSATALATILTSLISAGGISLALSRIDQNVGAIEGLETIGIVGGLLMLLALALAYYAGGYVAGRMSRFDGAWQGVGVWIMGIIVTLLLALAGVLFGSAYNITQVLNLPRIPVNEGVLTTGGFIALLVSAAITLAAAIAGGKIGERYHHKVDRAGVNR
jgi:hypothetical protein